MSDDILITHITGFSATGVHAGLKGNGLPDVALVVSDRDCTAAGTFTTNLVRAAPVRYDEALLGRTATTLRAVVVNAKNANAVTGEQGDHDAAAMALIAEHALGLAPDSALVMSTGIIGVPMPMALIDAGIREAARTLGTDDDAALRASDAILTTDTHPKRSGRRFDIGGATVTIAGVAKGAGMIHPDMATMLGLIVTDATIAAAPLRAALRYAVDRSYHCISVDGDTSTNDTQLVLANGAAGNDPIDSEEHPDFALFRARLTEVCASLARQIAWDGEGATKQVTIQVRGTRTFEEARQIGRTIATSPLVKTALFGRDANWGRVLAAAGRAGVPFDPSRASLWFGGLRLLQDGMPVGIDEAAALDILSQRHVTLTLALDEGSASAVVWTCDFSLDYVNVNADYRT